VYTQKKFIAHTSLIFCLPAYQPTPGILIEHILKGPLCATLEGVRRVFLGGRLHSWRIFQKEFFMPDVVGFGPDLLGPSPSDTTFMATPSTHPRKKRRQMPHHPNMHKKSKMATLGGAPVEETGRPWVVAHRGADWAAKPKVDSGVVCEGVVVPISRPGPFGRRNTKPKWGLMK